MKRDGFFHAFLLFTLNVAQALDELKVTAPQWKKNAEKSRLPSNAYETL